MINNCQIKTYDADRSVTVAQQYRKGAYLLRALLRTPWTVQYLYVISRLTWHTLKSNMTYPVACNSIGLGRGFRIIG